TTPAGDAPVYEKQTLALPDKPSIAVLPFANMSGDPEQEYFSDGIAEDIITALSRMPWFFVKARNSTFTYKGRAIQVKAVSKELGARYVIEGSVRKSGDRVRITVQLIDAENDKHLWAERYDRELKEVFAVQDEITERIVASIAPGFLSAEMQRAHRKPAPNLGAWDHFMRALWHFARFNREDSVEAKRRVQKAIELDPRGAVYSGLLAIILVIEWLYGWHEHDSEALTEARRAAERAITLDDHNAQARRALGLVNLYSRRHDQAIRDFKQALELCPTEAENHALLGTTLGLAGDYLIGLRHVEEALRLSPRDTFRATWFNNLAMAASAAGDDKASVDWARKAIETNPTLPGGYRSLAASAGNLGRRSQARAALETLCELLPGLTVAHAKARLPFKNSADLERYLDGLRKAGLPE
ncbi:MAG: tetratricopeptide repeat protein, partial [Alphaproteobacteria bacterium]|nr:tetratricopeptide repeat protein [Alphaproteobacteria bacterium]